MKNILENVYLVGGAVRDSLLGHESKDKEYDVVGATTQAMSFLGLQSVDSDLAFSLGLGHKAS